MNGSLDQMSKRLNFSLDSKEAKILKGEFVGLGVGDIDEVANEGFVFFSENYFNDNPKQDVREWRISRDKLNVMPDGNLFMPIQPVKRDVSISVHTYEKNMRQIHIGHTATFIKTNDPEKEDHIFGPNVYFKENKQRLLYKNVEEMTDWLKILQVIREPKVEIGDQQRRILRQPTLYESMMC